MNDRTTKARKPKQPLSDEERIHFALERYAPLRKGERRKDIKQIALKYNRQPAVVQKAIQSAFARGLVDIVQVKFPSPTRLPEYEEKLLENFPKLHRAIVVDVLPANRPSQDERVLFGDKVHEELGNALAEIISSNTVIDDNDVIGIGSGRGVFHVLNALRFLEKLRARNVTAISLTGDVYARSHGYWKQNTTSAGVQSTRWQLDADDHLSILSSSFLGPLNPLPLSRSIAWEQGELIKMVKRTVLDHDEWEKHIPDIGLVGVGVFCEGHRLYQEVKSPPGPHKQPLTPIISDLQILNNRIEELSRYSPVSTYVPVADICNRLFFVRPPTGVRITKEQETQIVHLIARINEKLLTATEEQLGQIKRLILVAGTQKKALAIKQLLEEDKFNIRIVCMDRSAAAEVITSSAG
jgi:DNA-binding transcriptional regulator LsrR (DeoR family)